MVRFAVMSLKEAILEANQVVATRVSRRDPGRLRARLVVWVDCLLCCRGRSNVIKMA
jgi:hypothetical protein